MNLSLRSLFLVVGSALSARLFAYFAIDAETALSRTGWISILAALVVNFPAIWMLWILEKKAPQKTPCEAFTAAAGVWTLRVVCAAAILVLLYDTAAMMQLLAESAGYSVWPMRPRTVLRLVTYLTLLYMLTRNGNAAAAAGHIGARFCAVMALIILLAQLPSIKLHYLTPVLGNGLVDIGRGAWTASGILGLIFPVYLIAEKDPEHTPHRERRLTMFLPMLPALFSAALLVFFSALTPFLDRTTTRLFRLDLLISNGRTSLSLQFPLMIVWLTGLLVLISFEILLAARLLQRLFPRLKNGPAGAIICTGGYGLSMFSFVEGIPLIFAQTLYFGPTVCLPLLACLAALIRQRINAGKELHS